MLLLFKSLTLSIYSHDESRSQRLILWIGASHRFGPGCTIMGSALTECITQSPSPCQIQGSNVDCVCVADRSTVVMFFYCFLHVASILYSVESAGMPERAIMISLESLWLDDAPQELQSSSGNHHDQQHVQSDTQQQQFSDRPRLPLVHVDKVVPLFDCGPLSVRSPAGQFFVVVVNVRDPSVVRDWFVG